MSIEIISTSDLRWQQYLDTVPHDFYHLPGYLKLESKRYNAIAEAVLIIEGDKTFFLPYSIRNCYQPLTSIAATDRREPVQSLIAAHAGATREPALSIGNTIQFSSNIDLEHQIERPFPFQANGIYDVISPYGYPGMLISEAGRDANFIKKCWNLVQQHWKDSNICSAFIRLHPILNDYMDCLDGELDDRSVVCDQGDVVVCDLTNSLEEIWQQIRKSHRTKINKLKNAGFTCRMGSIDRDLNTFVDIYHETMHRVNADNSYFFTNSYFAELIEALGEKVNICVVEIDDKVAAAALVTEFSGTIQYHLGGTKTEFLPQSPTIAMFNYIINWSKERGNKYFNLGGGLGGHEDSLYHFKVGFSKATKSYKTIRSVVNEDSYEYLTDLRARYLGKNVAEMKSSAFFPIYRSS
jgi:hypothetical protein